MPEIGIITNPNSKLNKRNPDLIKKIEERKPSGSRLFVTPSVADLDSFAKELLAEDIKLLAICGGDGTISRTITAIINAYGPHPLPKFAILPGGTMNLLASQIGQGGSILRNLKSLGEVHIGGSGRFAIQTIQIGTSYGFLYADGSNFEILQEFYKKKTGHIGAFFLGTKMVSSFLVKGQLIRKLVRAEKVTIASEETGSINLDSLGNFAGTINRLPLGFPFLPHAREDLQKFQFTLITCRADKLLWRLPAIMLQHQKGRTPIKFSECSKQLIIRKSEDFGFTIDGENFRSVDKHVSINCGPIVEFFTL